MYTGSLPDTSIFGTWSETIEIWSADDDTMMDLSGLTEITLRLRDKAFMADIMILTMSGGDITIPSQGIIQWRVEAARMGALEGKTYEVVLTLEDGTDTVPLIVGLVSVVE